MHAPVFDLAVEHAASGERGVSRDTVTLIGDHANSGSGIAFITIVAVVIELVKGLDTGADRQPIAEIRGHLDDMAAVREDFKEVLSEAKGEGFDVKIIRRLLAEMQKDPAKRREEAEMLDLYATSIGVEL